MIAKLQAWLATNLLVMALGATLGAAGVLAWEHHAPFGWGLAQKYAKATGELTQALADVGALTVNRQGWVDAYRRCDADRWRMNTSAAAQVTSASVEQARAASNAFDQGYAAGRAAGRRSCTTGGTHEDLSPAGDPVGDLIDRSVREPGADFADLWRAGAYVPDGAVPAGAGRAVQGRAPSS